MPASLEALNAIIDMQDSSDEDIDAYNRKHYPDELEKAKRFNASIAGSVGQPIPQTQNKNTMQTPPDGYFEQYAGKQKTVMPPEDYSLGDEATLRTGEESAFKRPGLESFYRKK